jgi:DNA polymerase III epsilon subunit-like protein
MHIHGITDQDVLGQPEPWQAISELIQFSKDALMVAHNARFDGVFLQKYLCQMAEQKDMEFENADNLYLKSSANFLSSNFASPIFSSANSALKEEETVNWQGIAVLDTVTLARHIFPGFPSYSLMNLKKRWGIQTEREHRGLDDAMAAAKILIKCLKKIKEASLGFYFQELWMVSPGSFISGTLKPGKKTIKNEKKMRFAINNAIYHNETIAISYQDLTGVVTKREVTPLRLFYNYTEQYLEAFCHLRNDKRLFRLERMKLS